MGAIEVVNKTKEKTFGGTIAVVVASNAADLALGGHDVKGTLNTYLRQGMLLEQTVMCGSFPEDTEMLQVALFYGAKYNAVEKMLAGEMQNNFEFVKGYRVMCRGKNVLLKFKAGDLEPQKGELRGLGKRRSMGGGIDMKTNITSLERIEMDTTTSSCAVAPGTSLTLTTTRHT